MKAMILAAGLGTRLRPLTNDRPKALVEVNGRTLLELTLLRLKKFGVTEVIVNVHHFADMVVEYLETKNNFKMRIEVSCEDELLDTGGGLKKAAWFFLEDSAGRDTPFILHNVDVISTIDLGRMKQFHQQRHALATLAVQRRETSRYLLFDQHMQLCGRRTGGDGENEIVRPASQAEALAFSGVHVISPHIFESMTEDGAFSIISTYLRLAAEGQDVLGFRADEYYWLDLGRPQNVARAEEDLASGILSN
ncbi:MAG: sugar phosphate nucleotidyltransferase [Candidatus Sulfotelmatobacter sp.]|jgi:NDP-sugar pyrophosphorylase family protein